MESSLNLFVILMLATFLLALTGAVTGIILIVKTGRMKRETEKKMDEIKAEINAHADEISVRQRKYIGESLSSLTETVTRGVVNIGKK